MDQAWANALRARLHGLRDAILSAAARRHPIRRSGAVTWCRSSSRGNPTDPFWASQHRPLLSGLLADPPVLNAIKQLPSGLHSVYRYDANFPDDESQQGLRVGLIRERSGGPAADTNWSWPEHTWPSRSSPRASEPNRRQNRTAKQSFASEIRGMTVPSPFPRAGEAMTMRDSEPDDSSTTRRPGADAASDLRAMVDWSCALAYCREPDPRAGVERSGSALQGLHLSADFRTAVSPTGERFGRRAIPFPGVAQVAASVGALPRGWHRCWR